MDPDLCRLKRLLVRILTCQLHILPVTIILQLVWIDGQFKNCLSFQKLHFFVACLQHLQTLYLVPYARISKIFYKI